MITLGIPIWTFRSHNDVCEPFNTFSKYTPEKPEVHAAQRTAISPANWLCLSESDLVASWFPETCTIETPIVNKTKAAHFFNENFRYSGFEVFSRRKKCELKEYQIDQIRLRDTYL